MPNSRHQRNHRHKDEDAHNNNHQAPALSTREREVAAAGAVNGSATGNHAHQNDNAGAGLKKCCTPGACRAPDDTIDPEEPFDAVKVICNNENCTESTWMHKDCFEDFEHSVLAYLRSCGRARSWSEKQRLQNLWTKKGYDLAFKACDCKCSRGHLRKDLDYVPVPFNENSKKHRKHKKKNDKPMPVVSTTHKANSQSSHTPHQNGTPSSTTSTTTPTTTSGTRGQQNGGRSEKKSKKSSSTTKGPEVQTHDNDGNSLPQNQDNHSKSTPISTTTNNNHITTGNHNQGHSSNGHYLPPPSAPELRLRTNSVSSTCSAGSHSSSSSNSGVPSSAGSPSPISSSPVSGDMFFKNRKSSDASTDSSSSGSSSSYGYSSSIFRQRANFSAFAVLPRNKQNPYHIRMEDAATLAYSFAAYSLSSSGKAHAPPPPPYPLPEVSTEIGSDLETRSFVLCNLQSKRQSCVRCSLCKAALPVYDRFPLLDGTFFLSPQSYDETAVQVIWDGRLQFLNAACLGCLEGHTVVRCLACKRPWEGSNLVLGSMYAYDILAASPCCQKRLTCKCCFRAVVDVSKGLEFYSQYSQMIICPYCKANDYHFIRSLQETFLVSPSSSVSSSSSPLLPREQGANRSGPICQ